MYYPPNTQWQQSQPPPPQGGPPPPPPPMTAEAAAAYQNYGYGNVAPRPGKRNGQAGRGPQAQQPMYPGAGPYPPGQAPMMHPGQPAPGHQPPAKRAKYDSKGAASPVYMQHPPPAGPHAGTPPYPGQVYQPTMYSVPGQPPQQAMPMSAGQPYYPQQTYAAYPAPSHPGLPQHPYQYQQPMYNAPAQAYQPHQQHQTASTSAPPLAVALMKATPMAATNSGGNSNSRPPPPPPSSAPLPPPPPTEVSLPSGPKGLASLPERPMSSTLPPAPSSAPSTSSNPVGPGVPTGPSSFKTTIKRDTRPLPSQSRHAGDSLRGPGGRGGGSGGGQRGRGPPTGPARGGGGGRGGRGGGRSGGFDNQRGPNRPPQNHQNRRDDRNDQSAQDREKEKGAKRTFSQTGPPANSPRGPASRPRTNSNATATSASIPTGPSKKSQANATKKRDRTMEGSPAPSPSSNKGLKRTLTDFRIESLEIPSLKWSWKAAPLSQILAKMNLKEREDLGVSKVEESPIVKVDVIERLHEQDSKPEQEETEDQHVTPHASPTMPSLERMYEQGTETDANDNAVSSVNLERSDSRPEKRKHARDEDEDEETERLRQAASEEAKDAASYPVGKKVKSEVVEDLPSTVEVASAAEASLPETAVVADTPEEPATNSAEEQVGANDTKPMEDGDDVVREEPDAMQDKKNAQETPAEDLVSDTGDSADEVADSIIASRPSEDEKHDRETASAPVADDTESLADVSVSAADDADGREREESPLIVTQLKGSDASKNVPKKFWENSRLRIYFMSPVELEQKEVRQKLKKQKIATVPAPNEPEVKHREVSVETVTSKTIAVSEESEKTALAEINLKTVEEDQKPDVVDETNNGTDQNTDATDDLDGEPLAAEAQPSEDKKDVSNAVCEDKEEKAEATPAGSAEPGPSQATAVSDLITQAEQTLSLPSADRLSVAYAQNTRRLVIDAEVVDELVLHRAEGKIEITLRVEEPLSVQEGKDFRCARGVYVEKATASGEQSYEEIGRQELQTAWEAEESASSLTLDGESAAAGHLSPPLHRLLVKPESPPEGGASGRVHRFTIVARMDRAHPLTEAKWVRTGNPDDWILSVIGNGGENTSLSSSSGARAAQQLPKGEQGNEPSSSASKSAPNVTGSAWKGKIRVVDPDAPPTFQHALENWLSAASSRGGFDETRYRFVNEHFKDINNVLEVLLRLIRGSSGAGSSSFGSGDRSLSSNMSGQSASLASQALASGAPYPEAQTPVSLAAFQLFQLGIGTALQAGTPRKDIDRRVGEIVRNLPYSLIFRSLDSMFADYKKMVVVSK